MNEIAVDGTTSGGSHTFHLRRGCQERHCWLRTCGPSTGLRLPEHALEFFSKKTTEKQLPPLQIFARATISANGASDGPSRQPHRAGHGKGRKGKDTSSKTRSRPLRACALTAASFLPNLDPLPSYRPPLLSHLRTVHHASCLLYLLSCAPSCFAECCPRRSRLRCSQGN